MCLHQVITCLCWHQCMLSNCCNCCGCLPGCVCRVVNLFTSPPSSLPVRRNPMTASLSPLAPSFYMHWVQSQPGLQVSEWLHPLPPPVHLPSHPHTASLSLFHPIRLCIPRPTLPPSGPRSFSVCSTYPEQAATPCSLETCSSFSRCLYNIFLVSSLTWPLSFFFLCVYVCVRAWLRDACVDAQWIAVSREWVL